jgi:predicted transcriptional regulator
LPDLRAHSTVFELIRVLPGAPIISARTAATLVHRSIPSVNEALTHLVQAGILRQTTAQARNRVFEAPDIIEAFTDLERGLASPIGDTISDPPVRPVPARRIRKARSPR